MMMFRRDRPVIFFRIRCLHLPADVEETLKILVMVPKQLQAELASELDPGPAENTLDAGKPQGLYDSTEQGSRSSMQ